MKFTNDNNKKKKKIIQIFKSLLLIKIVIFHWKWVNSDFAVNLINWLII